MLVVPLNTNRVSVFNLEADCPEYDDQSDVACGMLGTRNLVGTAFVVQLVLSFRSVLSGERVWPGEKPLLVQFTNTVAARRRVKRRRTTGTTTRSRRRTRRSWCRGCSCRSTASPTTA